MSRPSFDSCRKDFKGQVLEKYRAMSPDRRQEELKALDGIIEQYDLDREAMLDDETSQEQFQDATCRRILLLRVMAECTSIEGAVGKTLADRNEAQDDGPMGIPVLA